MDPKNFFKELNDHIPFTLFAILTAILLTILIVYYFQKDIPMSLFESVHILHIIVSTIVTTGIYYKYSRKITTSIIVGMLGAIIIGSLSDILFPWMGGTLLGIKTHFHLPLIETPIIVITTLLIGSIIGIKTKLTKIPHFIHVFLSVFASLFYLLVFSATFSLNYFMGAFLIVFVSVIIPCCISDITFPFFFLKKKKEKHRWNKN